MAPQLAGGCLVKVEASLCPYKGTMLFGEALDPILIENKDRKKVMLGMFRRADRRPSPYYRRPSFWPPNMDITSEQRFGPQRQDCHPERPRFCD